MGWDTVGEKFLDLIKILFTRKKASDVFKDSVKINEVSKGCVLSGLSVDCFFLVMAHNGSGILKPHGFKFCSIMDGTWNDVLIRRFKIEDYRNIEIDYDYAMLLINIRHYKEYSSKTEEMNGNLRTRFEYEGITFAKFFFLKEDRNAMWFIVAGTTAHDECFKTQAKRQLLSVAVNKVKNIIRKY